MILPDVAAQRVVTAFEARNSTAFETSCRELADAVKAASAEDLPPALARLGSVLAVAPLGPAVELAVLTGAIADRATDRTLLLDMFVERACQAMEKAAQFLALHRDLFGEPPTAKDGPEAIQATLFRFMAATRRQVDDPMSLIQAWFTGNDWVQPLLVLAQHAEVRASLPQLSRLLTATDAVSEQFENAYWVRGLLEVIDDVQILVLHRETGRGYRVTIGGIADNFQLHTLLADRLVGDVEAGWLPGVRPTPEMIAAADGTGPMEPDSPIMGQFNLVDPYGTWIWNEGRPADIPLFEGERVVVLDPPPYERGWNAGRLYPHMRPTCRVDARLTRAEAAKWLALVEPAAGFGTPSAGGPTG